MPFSEINERSQHIFRHIVDLYVESGEAVGSRTLAKRMGMNLSPATIRNVMSDLEDVGLLYAHHTSAGRLPTDLGLKFFVDGMLEVGSLNLQEKKQIEKELKKKDLSVKAAVEHAGRMLSGLSQCAGIVAAPKRDRPLKQIEFVNLGPGRILAVLVSQDGSVENRLLEVSKDVNISMLEQASNFINSMLVGRTLDEARDVIGHELKVRQNELDQLTKKVISQGLAERASGDDGVLIIRGQANLLSDVKQIEELERIRQLFETLETREAMVKLLEQAESAEGVQIYIGSESTLFDHAGCSMIVTPYRNSQKQLVGAIGVIGPTRLNYARIVPMVDYTAKLLGKIAG